jgi:hypothetical protein
MAPYSFITDHDPAQRVNDWDRSTGGKKRCPEPFNVSGGN